jgi:glutamate synthase domain-containing protein 3
MTGGECFLLDADEQLVNADLVALVGLESDDEERLIRLLERHARLTGSTRAAALLLEPVATLTRFRLVLPRTALVERTTSDGIQRKLSA